MFEQASRLKLRFTTNRGQLSVEDLWDLKLEDLDTLAKGLNKEIKESSEESFIKTRTNANKLLELKFNLAKHIIDIKLAEKEAKALKLQKAQKAETLRDLIAKKQLSAMEEKSVEELTKELAEMEA